MRHGRDVYCCLTFWPALHTWCSCPTVCRRAVIKTADIYCTCTVSEEWREWAFQNQSSHGIRYHLVQLSMGWHRIRMYSERNVVVNAACCVLVTDDWGGVECTVAWTGGKKQRHSCTQLHFFPFAHSSKVKSPCACVSVLKVCVAGSSSHDQGPVTYSMFVIQCQ